MRVRRTFRRTTRSAEAARAGGTDLAAVLRRGDSAADVEHAVAETPVPAPVTRRGPLEDPCDLVAVQGRVGGPDERRGAGDLGRRERGAAREAVDPVAGAGQRVPRPVAGPRVGGQRPEHVLTGRRERDPGTGVGEGGAPAVLRRGADREADAAASLRAHRLEQRRRILDRVAGLELVARGCHDEDAVLGRIVQRLLLERGCLDPADREIDDLGAVVDRVDDGVGLVDVGEGAVRAAGLDEEQLRVAAEAGDPLAVRHRAAGDRGDERPVAVEVADVGVRVEDVVGLRSLGGEIGGPDIGARVDHGDLHAGRRAEDRPPARRPRGSPRTATGRARRRSTWPSTPAPTPRSGARASPPRRSRRPVTRRRRSRRDRRAGPPRNERLEDAERFAPESGRAPGAKRCDVRR